MKKFLAALLFLALTGTLNSAILHQDRDDRRERDDHRDNGKHKGGEKHRDGDDGERHDNGRHKGWDNPNNPHANWDSDHDRIHPGRSYPYGRYDHMKVVINARRFDPRTRRVILYDNSNWVMASYDLPRCRDWDWDRDRVYVYDDDHHPGWYLLFNARLGRYVHVEYYGVH
jgi:hypothetical protein